MYRKYAKKKDITHLASWAHARREFERALDNDRPRAEKELLMIQELYALERRAREEKLAPDQIRELRREESLPVINGLGKWIFKEIKNTLPKSRIGKAMAYTLAGYSSSFCASDFGSNDAIYCVKAAVFTVRFVPLVNIRGTFSLSVLSPIIHYG